MPPLVSHFAHPVKNGREVRRAAGAVDSATEHINTPHHPSIDTESKPKKGTFIHMHVWGVLKIQFRSQDLPNGKCGLIKGH